MRNGGKHHLECLLRPNRKEKRKKTASKADPLIRRAEAAAIREIAVLSSKDGDRPTRLLLLYALNIVQCHRLRPPRRVFDKLLMGVRKRRSTRAVEPKLGHFRRDGRPCAEGLSRIRTSSVQATSPIRKKKKKVIYLVHPRSAGLRRHHTQRLYLQRPVTNMALARGDAKTNSSDTLRPLSSSCLPLGARSTNDDCMRRPCLLRGIEPGHSVADQIPSLAAGHTQKESAAVRDTGVMSKVRHETGHCPLLAP